MRGSLKSARYSLQAVLQSRPLPTVPPRTPQRSAEAASSHFGTMHSVTLSHFRLVPVHVPSFLPSPGLESPAQSRCLPTQHVTISAGLPHAERDASRRIFGTQARGTEPQERVPSAPGAQALSSRSFLVTQRT